GPDLHVGHAAGVKLTLVGAQLHAADAIGVDMRIDGLAAEDEIADARDIDMQRIGGALRNVDRAPAVDVDMHPTVDAGGVEVAASVEVQMQPLADCAGIGRTRAGGLGVDALRGLRLDVARARDLQMQIAADVAELDLARAGHGDMRFPGAADRGV